MRARRTFSFRGLAAVEDARPLGLGALGAFLTHSNSADAFFKGEETVHAADVSAAYADKAIQDAPAVQAADAEKAAAAAAAAAAAIAAEDAARATANREAVEKIVAERSQGGSSLTKTVLVPQNLQNDLDNARQAEKAAKEHASQTQAQLEEVSLGARLGSAAKWAFMPVGAGAILMVASYKKVGFTLAVAGLGLGVFRFFKKPPLDEAYPEET